MSGPHYLFNGIDVITLHWLAGLMGHFCVAGFTNETPRDYHCNLGPDGRRRDADQRPELSKGTVEFVASKEYLVRSAF